MLPADPSPTEARVIVPDDDERLIDVATRAIRDEMFVIHNGSQVIVCSIIPVGGKKLAIRAAPDGLVGDPSVRDSVHLRSRRRGNLRPMVA